MARSIERLYEDDFFAWTQLQARELERFRRTRPNVPLDLRHLAEEIRDLGMAERNALRSWTARIVEHLLLLEHSPAQEPRRGWSSEVVDFRDEIEQRLTRTLRRDLERQLPALYRRSRSRLTKKLRLHGEAELALKLATQCPYTLDQILGEWWPDEAGGPSKLA
jgi:hypothetical protein